MRPLGGGFNLEFGIVRPLGALLLESPAASRAPIPERAVIVATNPAALPRKLLLFIMISLVCAPSPGGGRAISLLAMAGPKPVPVASGGPPKTVLKGPSKGVGALEAD